MVYRRQKTRKRASVIGPDRGSEKDGGELQLGDAEARARRCLFLL